MATQVEPERIDLGLASIAEGERAKFLAGEFGSCADLANGENYCREGRHGIGKDQGEGQFPEVKVTRTCPLFVARELVRRRRQALADCPMVVTIAERYEVKFDVQRPLWAQLLKAMDPERSVTWTMDGKNYKPLRKLLELVELGCRQPNRQAPHLMLQGNCGTGKTTIQGVLYLAAYEAGLSVAMFDSLFLRTLATNLASRYEPTQRAADQELSGLVKRDVLVWSDVADTQATRHEFAETVTSLLERFSGRLILSANLKPDQLMQHPDIQARAVSRMLAGRHGKASVVVELAGVDQRKNGTPLQTVTEL